MKVGDLIKIKECGDRVLTNDKANWGCGCFLCLNESSRIGLVVNYSGTGYWAMFDCGEFHVSNKLYETGHVHTCNPVKPHADIKTITIAPIEDHTTEIY